MFNISGIVKFQITESGYPCQFLYSMDNVQIYADSCNNRNKNEDRWCAIKLTAMGEIVISKCIENIGKELY